MDGLHCGKMGGTLLAVERQLFFLGRGGRGSWTDGMGLVGGEGVSTRVEDGGGEHHDGALGAFIGLRAAPLA